MTLGLAALALACGDEAARREAGPEVVPEIVGAAAVSGGRSVEAPVEAGAGGPGAPEVSDEPVAGAPAPARPEAAGAVAETGASVEAGSSAAGGAAPVSGEAAAPVLAGAEAGAARPEGAKVSRVKPAVLLGRSEAEVAGLLGPAKGSRAGWTRHGAFELRVRGGRVTAVRGPTPWDIDCMELPRWLGYAQAGVPLRRAETCEWPGISLRHRLAPGVVGTYEMAARRFEVRLASQ